MNKDTKYFLKVILLGFGIIPSAASFLCAIPFLTGLGGVNKQIMALIFIVFFSAAAFLSVKLTAKNHPNGFTARYLPVCLPLMITLVTCAVCMVISKSLFSISLTTRK